MLDQELKKEQLLQSSRARHNRSTALDNQITEPGGDKENHDPQSNSARKAVEVKRDFFGRIIEDQHPQSADTDVKRQSHDKVKEADRVWASFNEGFSNAVRKPITLRELMDGF